MMERSIFQKSAMKGMMKGKILKKLKSIKQVGYLKPDRILQVTAAEGFVESIQKISNFVTQSPLKKIEQGNLSLKLEKQSMGGGQEADVIDVSELMRDLDEEGEESEVEDKENVRPIGTTEAKDSILVDRVDEKATLSEIDVSSFRRPDMNSGSLFDPKLLAAFEEARRVQRLASLQAEENLLTELESECEEEPPSKVQKTEHMDDPITEFEYKCPPGGSDAIILYTTTLRGIRKTFEDCQSIRFLLQTFKVRFFERDVSMHAEYRAEMCGVLGEEKALPPRLFVKGRYVGGAEEVLRLHEQGRFRRLLEGVGVDEEDGKCDGCGGVRFVVCFKCSGSGRVICGDDWLKCGGGCNENGLIICPYCC